MRQWLWLWLGMVLVVTPAWAQGGGGGGNRAEPSRGFWEAAPRPWQEVVQTEVDRAFRSTTILLNLLLLVLILWPIAVGLGLWGLRRCIVWHLVETASKRVHQQIATQAETAIAELINQQLTHYRLTLAALQAESRQALEQEWQKRLHSLQDATERVSPAPPDLPRVLSRLRQWLSDPRSELPPDLYQTLVAWAQQDGSALTGADCLLLGQVWQQLGQWEKALAYYQQASDRQPDAWEAWYHLGLALTHHQRYAEALASFERALALQPAASHIRAQRDAALEQLRQHIS
ncbi:tetratricopeptide repeat protein [Gloeomargarita sp.]